MDDQNSVSLGRRTFLGGMGASAGLLLANDGLPAWISAPFGLFLSY